MEGVKVFMRSVLSKEPWHYDPLVIRKQWNENEYQLSEHNGGKELCFAVMWDDGVTMPHPPVRRSLELTKTALIRAGYKCLLALPSSFTC
jgi:amidase